VLFRSVAYTAILLIAIINLGRTLINTLVPPKRVHKVASLRRLLEVACAKFGYTLNAPIDELDFISFLPSNPRNDDKTFFGLIDTPRGTPVGIPASVDAGWYICGDLFQRVKDLFFAKISIVNNVVNIIPRISNFWVQQSTWQFPDVRLERKAYNTEDLKANRVLSFQIDQFDTWTIDNYEGNAIEVNTVPITVNNQEAVLLKGNERFDFRAALGTPKDKLNAIENLLAEVGGAIDAITGVFGNGTDFANQINAKVGVLKQSNNYHTIPKLLYNVNNRIPINQKDFWSAPVLYNKYHKESSFVLDNGRGQKILRNNVDIPMGFDDFQELTNNSYFFLNGQSSKITKFEWKMAQDTAVVSFWTREK